VNGLTIKSNRNLLKMLQERLDKANRRRTPTAEETKRLNKLETMADKLKRGENVQNRQLQTWLSDDEYTQIEAEWRLDKRNDFFRRYPHRAGNKIWDKERVKPSFSVSNNCKDTFVKYRH
jgi:hypothetical protein